MTADSAGWAQEVHGQERFLRGRFFWQKELRLPAGFGPGDVLVVAGNPRYLSNFPLISAARRLGGGIVWWGHGWSPTSSRLGARIRYSMMSLADVVLLYADREIEPIKREASSRLLFLATNNSLDPTAMLKAEREWPPQALEKFSADASLQNKKVILFCGRLRRFPSTGIDLAIKALAGAGAQASSYVLVIVGCGDQEEELRALAASLGVAASIKWLGPLYDESALAPWFLLADCFVYPGAIGLSLIHAFTYGVPVITHDAVAFHNPEIHALRDGENGVLFRRDDAADLWRCVADVCESPARNAALSRAARKTALEEWSFAGMIERFERAVTSASEISLARAGK